MNIFLGFFFEKKETHEKMKNGKNEKMNKTTKFKNMINDKEMKKVAPSLLSATAGVTVQQTPKRKVGVR